MRSLTLCLISNGKPFVSTWPDYEHGFDRWNWITRMIAEQFKCQQDDVSLIENEAHGETYTVLGEPVAYLLNRGN